MFILIICFPVYEVLNFEIKLSSLIKPFFRITKKIRTKVEYLKNEKSFYRRSFFIIFERLSATKNCLRTESGPLGP